MRCTLLLVVEVELPIFQIIFSVVQNLSGLCAVAVWAALITRNDRAVIEELQETAAVAGEDDLLLGALNGGDEFGVIRLLELLTSLFRASQCHFLHNETSCIAAHKSAARS